MEKTTATIKDLKSGSFIMIDDVPCKVDRVDISKSGKHGASKCRIEAVALMDGRRHSLAKPSSDVVSVPIILKKKAQVVAIIGDKAQLMDLSDYSVIELEIPEERKDQVKQGEEIEYYEVADIRTLKQIKG